MQWTLVLRDTSGLHLINVDISVSLPQMSGDTDCKHMTSASVRVDKPALWWQTSSLPFPLASRLCDSRSCAGLFQDFCTWAPIRWGCQATTNNAHADKSQGLPSISRYTCSKLTLKKLMFFHCKCFFTYFLKLFAHYINLPETWFISLMQPNELRPRTHQTCTVYIEWKSGI